MVTMTVISVDGFTSAGGPMTDDKIRYITSELFEDGADFLDESNRPAYDDGRKTPCTLEECCDYLELYGGYKFKR